MSKITKADPQSTFGFAKSFAFPEFAELVEYRKRVDDCLQGQRNIKRKQQYLPPNQWQKEHDDQYQAYLQRALFYSMTTYAMRIYEGLTMSGEPEIILPKDGGMDFLRKWATVHKRSLHTLQNSLNYDQFASGLRCMLVEPQNNDERPFFIQEFSANCFLRAHFFKSDGESKAKVVLLNQSGFKFDLKTKKDEWRESLLVLGLDRNGEYYQSLITFAQWGESFDVDNPPATNEANGVVTVYPNCRKSRLNFIPFTWCGATTLSGSTMDLPPLLDMADCEIKLFQLDAQYAQHIFQSSQETIFFTGNTQGLDLKDIRYGSGAHNKLPRDCDVKVISNNGVGFQAQAEYMKSIMEQIELRRMSIMSSKSHQSGTAIGIVQNAQTAPLRTVVTTSGDAITEQMRYIATWMGYGASEIAKIRYTPSKDFANVDSNLSEFVALCRAVTDGVVPMLEEDLYRKAKENGYVNSKLEWDEFKARWELEKLDRQDNLGYIPTSTSRMFNLNPKQDKQQQSPDNNNGDDGKNTTKNNDSETKKRK